MRKQVRHYTLENKSFAEDLIRKKKKKKSAMFDIAAGILFRQVGREMDRYLERSERKRL